MNRAIKYVNFFLIAFELLFCGAQICGHQIYFGGGDADFF